MKQVGKYQLVRKLAKGGMAEVFLAQTSGPAGFQKQLVLKRILPQFVEDPTFVEMFLNEARLAAQLNHPNVVQIFDLGEADGAYFIAMEYIDGPNLRRLGRGAAEQKRPFPVEAAAKIIAITAEALAYAHDFRRDGQPMNLIHRDVSPDNILLSSAGAVKLVDFGIAKAADHPHLTKTGAVKGKMSYMSPEQIRGQPLDRRTDVFALGVTLYELLAGVKPFNATSEVAAMQAILFEPPRPLNEVRAELPAEVLAVVARGLEKDNEKRYPSCRQMQADLERFLMARGALVSAVDLATLVAELCPQKEPPAGAPPEARPTTPASSRRPPPGSPDPEDGAAAEAVPDLSQASTQVAAPQLLVRRKEPVAAPSARAPAPTRVSRARWAVPLIVTGMGLGGAAAAFLGLRSVLQISVEAPLPAIPGAPVKAVEAPPARSPQGPTEVVPYSGRASPGPAGPASGAPPMTSPPAAPSLAAPAALPAPMVAPSAPASETVTPPAPRPTGVVAAPRRGPTRPAAPEAPSAPASRPSRQGPTRIDPGGAPAGAASATATGSLTIATDPPVAVTVDGRPRGVAPVTLHDLPGGPHEVVVSDPAKGVHRRLSVHVPAGGSHREDIKFQTGTLRLRVKPWAQVEVDGKPYGVTPIDTITLFEGEHRVRLTNQELRAERVLTVWIAASREEVVKVNLAD